AGTSTGRPVPGGFADPLVSKLEAAILHTPLSTESRRAVTTGLESPTGSGPPTATGSPSSPAVPSQSAQPSQATALPATDDSNATGHHVAQAVELLFGTAEFQRR